MPHCIRHNAGKPYAMVQLNPVSMHCMYVAGQEALLCLACLSETHRDNFDPDLESWQGGHEALIMLCSVDA